MATGKIQSARMEKAVGAGYTDFNYFKKNGWYLIGNASALSNAPTGIGSSGYLLVFASDVSGYPYIIQMCLLNKGRQSRLSFDNGSTWTSWV